MKIRQFSRTLRDDYSHTASKKNAVCVINLSFPLENILGLLGKHSGFIRKQTRVCSKTGRKVLNMKTCKKEQTVRKRIFISNTVMVLITLSFFLLVNLLSVKIYSKAVENELIQSAEFILSPDDISALDKLLEDLTVHQKSFFLIFGATEIICIIFLIFVSMLFTDKLSKKIFFPLSLLLDGVERIKEKDFSKNIEYTGDKEFEEVCSAFNKMQASLLKEKEKNRKYEKARRDMVSGISHDLRTPLTAVKGSIKAVLDKIASTKEQEEAFLHSAYRRTDEMEGLLRQLLYFSRLESGNIPVTLQKISISSFLENYAASVQKSRRINNESITFETGNSPENLFLNADTEHLRRILDNLLENSRKYSEADFLKIKIILEKEGSNVYVHFFDNGKGVPEEKLPHIFEEFYRADESRNQKEGNGLGLYIVKYLMNAMNGNVTAKNTEAGFCITLIFNGNL